MRRPNDPRSNFPSMDPSGEFGSKEALAIYNGMSEKYPHGKVGKLADVVIKLAIDIYDRSDVDPEIAKAALLGKLYREAFPTDLSNLMDMD